MVKEGFSYDHPLPQFQHVFCTIPPLFFSTILVLDFHLTHTHTHTHTFLLSFFPFFFQFQSLPYYSFSFFLSPSSTTTYYILSSTASFSHQIPSIAPRFPLPSFYSKKLQKHRPQKHISFQILLGPVFIYLSPDLLLLLPNQNHIRIDPWRLSSLSSTLAPSMSTITSQLRRPMLSCFFLVVAMGRRIRMMDHLELNPSPLPQRLLQWQPHNQKKNLSFYAGDLKQSSHMQERHRSLASWRSGKTGFKKLPRHQHRHRERMVLKGH